MKKFILSAGIMLAAAVTFAGTPKGETKDANTSEPKEASATKTQAILYWFDADNGTYMGHSELSGCLNDGTKACQNGYTQVANPSNPQEPSTAPAQVDTERQP